MLDMKLVSNKQCPRRERAVMFVFPLTLNAAIMKLLDALNSGLERNCSIADLFTAQAKIAIEINCVHTSVLSLIFPFFTYSTSDSGVDPMTWNKTGSRWLLIMFVICEEVAMTMTVRDCDFWSGSFPL